MLRLCDRGDNVSNAKNYHILTFRLWYIKIN